MSHIMLPNENDTLCMKELWKNCFRDSNLYIDSFFRLIYKRENSLALYEDGEIASYLMMFPKNVVVEGKKKSACYIGGVCTGEQFRHRGFASMLLENAFDIIKNKYDMAYLVPFRCDFYRRLGYECVSYLTVLEGDTAELMSHNDDMVSTDNRTEIYKEACRKSSFYEKRTQQDFDEMAFFASIEKGTFFCTESAYMYYRIVNGLFDVSEIVFADYKGLCNMLSFIAKNRECRKFRIRGSFELCRYICETKISVSLEPYAMVRSCNDKIKIERDLYNYINLPIWG